MLEARKEIASPEHDRDFVVPSSDAAGLLTRTVRVVAFTDEEGVRFQSTFLGSRALVRCSYWAHREVLGHIDLSLSYVPVSYTHLTLPTKRIV